MEKYEMEGVMWNTLLFFGTGVLMAGIGDAARAKRWTAALGIFAVLSVFGVVIVALLADHAKSAEQEDT